MMPYEILNFVILNANIKESSLGLNATNFDLEIDLHQSINIHIYIYIYCKWKHVVCCHVRL